ncbi:MAG: hypothetical protein E7439_05615 [Ruminococcaceae bacterium]|nr:hypothetical protein [Oscillospiraceae bacterium]
MKKLLLTLLALAMLCSLALPAMADEASPVKSYADAENGELLYTVDFTGKDGVLEFSNLGATNATKYFSYTPSADGSSLTVTGNLESGKEIGTYWGATIPSLKADLTTVYTMTYKAKANGDAGQNNSIGVGGYFVNGYTDDSMRNYNLYGNYATKDAAGNISTRRSSLSINNQKQNGYTMWNTLDAYEVDSEGFVSVMLVYDGAALNMSAYLRAEGAGDGSKQSDWVKVEDLVYVPADDCMGFMIYAYYIQEVNATVKDVNIYKGLIYEPAEEEPPATEPTEKPTENPTVKPTTAPTTEASDKTGQSSESFPWGIVIGVVAAGIGVVVVILVLKNKKKQ